MGVKRLMRKASREFGGADINLYYDPNPGYRNAKSWTAFIDDFKGPSREYPADALRAVIRQARGDVLRYAKELDRES